jgi:hypothetical protein
VHAVGISTKRIANIINSFENKQFQGEKSDYRKSGKILKRQAIREDGQLLIQTSNDAAAALSTLP